MVPATLDKVVQLYRSSMGLALLTQRFLREVEQLKRMALNTEVFAEREAQGAAVFQVLARELGRIAEDVREVVQALYASSRRVAGSAVQSAALVRRLEKYRLAIDHGVRGATAERLRRRLSIDDASFAAGSQAIEDSLRRADAALSDLSHLQQQLPMISTFLRIEASRDTLGDGALVASGGALDVASATIGALLTRVRGRTEETLLLLDDIGGEAERCAS